MRANHQLTRLARACTALALIALITGCSGDEPTQQSPGPAALPADVRVPDPASRWTDMTRVEDWTEAVANSWFGFSDKLRRRDFEAARSWLADDFAGKAWDRLKVSKTEELPLAVHRTTYDAASARIVGGGEFIAGLASHIGDWQRVELVLWKVKGAEFERVVPLTGKIRFKVTILGTGARGEALSLTAWADARVVLRDHQWRMDRFDLSSFTRTERASYMFSDVSVPAGVAFTSPRFAEDKQASFHWSGAAAGDVNADGRIDIFVPSRPRNFLYVADPQGGYVDRAEEFGVAERGGATSAVFFDYDNDGDQDLAVADVGWVEKDGSIGGNRLRLFVNEDNKRFVERGVEAGFSAVCHALGLCVLDYDGDGFLDVFVANYGRIEAEPNDSWTDSHNGSPDILLRNIGGQTFQDVTKAVGIVETRWSYAAAAADFDLDGDMDIVVANDYGKKAFWRNEGGKFTDVAKEIGVEDLGNGMGVTWGDLDGDGFLDLYAVNMSSTAGNRILGRLAGDETQRASLLKMASGNSIFLSRLVNGNRVFEQLPAAKGGIDGNWAWSAALADYDLDGKLDVFCTNGFITGEDPADT
ncbi:MAG: VCBS repeat-containing protein [Planctomycetes bacterium]|nr:VCBS repeat-containing protein [Planctomycetota bacterium]